MRRISGKDPVIDALLNDCDEVVYNLLYLIRQDANADFVTDDKSYIVAQSNAAAPIWVYSNAQTDKTACDEVYSILKEKISSNPNVHINAKQAFIQPVFARLSRELGIVFEVHTPINAYVCRRVKQVEVRGEAILPEEQYKPQIAELIKQMSMDAENYAMTDQEAEDYAEANQHAPNLFLWNVDGEIVAMARIAHKTDKYARINTVVTERAQRGNGYAKMLVGKLCSDLLAQGILPMLYADRRNPSSNSAYQKIGFEKVGEIAEYQICK